MGMNAYFAFQVVGYNGSGHIPYGVALTAVFTEGLIFVFLAMTGMRQWLVKLIPATIKTATGVGIGLFLTEIGLSYSAGIGAITGGYKATPLAIAGCPIEMIDPQTQMCDGGLMSNPKVLADASKCVRVTDNNAALDRHIRRRYFDSLSHGFPRQVRLYHWHCSGLYRFLAVRIPHSPRSKHITNKPLDAGRALPTSHIPRKESRGLTCSKRSSLSSPYDTH